MHMVHIMADSQFQFVQTALIEPTENMAAPVAFGNCMVVGLLAKQT